MYKCIVSVLLVQFGSKILWYTVAIRVVAKYTTIWRQGSSGPATVAAAFPTLGRSPDALGWLGGQSPAVGWCGADLLFWQRSCPGYRAAKGELLHHFCFLRILSVSSSLRILRWLPESLVLLGNSTQTRSL